MTHKIITDRTYGIGSCVRIDDPGTEHYPAHPGHGRAGRVVWNAGERGPGRDVLLSDGTVVNVSAYRLTRVPRWAVETITDDQVKAMADKIESWEW